jgi:mannosyltransferase
VRLAREHARPVARRAEYRARPVDRGAPRSLPSWWPIGALALITLAGAAFRVIGLGEQGFWYDEAHTALLVELTPGKMLGQLPVGESTPPLYYCAAWVWAHLFDAREAGLRSFSALAGTATIPVCYLAGRKLAGERSGLIAAALAATNPLLVWYSQEARAYELAVLLSAAAFLLFLYALEQPRWPLLAGWAVLSALAVATHYLAGLAVVPEAALLLLAGWRRAIPWVFVAAAGSAALLPLALSQRRNHLARWLGRIPLEVRLDQLGKQLLAGFGASLGWSLLAAAGLLVSVALLVRASRRERAAWVLATGIGVSAVALAFALLAFGSDELITRNVIVAIVPIIVAVAVGLGSRGAGAIGLAGAALVVAGWTGVDLSVANDPGLQRPDYRRVLAALGPARHGRLIMLEHHPGGLPFALYDRKLIRARRPDDFTVREVDVVAARGAHGRSCWWGASCNLSRAAITNIPPAGMRIVARTSVPNFRIVRFAGPRPMRYQIGRLANDLRHVGTGSAFFQRAGG